MKQIGWIDFSPDHRKRVAAVIDLLDKEGMVDELGIGTIRDSLSNMMFPGISTIQTRAKYFLIVPRIIRDYQIQLGKKGKHKPLAEYLREQENEIIWELASKYKDSKEDGIIGITTANYEKGRREIVRKPSTIYWNGLVTHNIVHTPLSYSQYLSRFGGEAQQLRHLLKDDKEGLADDRDADFVDMFGLAQLPEPLNNWMDELSIDLNPEEADFLSNHLMDLRGSDKKHEGNLLRLLLKNEKLLEIFKSCNSFQEAFSKLGGEQIPRDTKQILQMAYDFDRLIFGAHIRYNCMVSAQHGTTENRDAMEAKWSEWIIEITKNKRSLDHFDMGTLLNEICLTTKSTTKKFIRLWIQMLRENPTDTDAMDNLIKGQEIWNKRGKARLQEHIKEHVDGWVGLQHLDYRVSTARTILNDIWKAINPTNNEP